jgi:hypothetical protein
VNTPPLEEEQRRFSPRLKWTTTNRNICGKVANRRDQDLAVPTFDTYPGPGRPKDAATNGAVVGSLNASLAPNRNPPAQPATKQDDADTEDLFALPMSPRSPEMKKSPFSMLK